MPDDGVLDDEVVNDGDGANVEKVCGPARSSQGSMRSQSRRQEVGGGAGAAACAGAMTAMVVMRPWPRHGAGAPRLSSPKSAGGGGSGLGSGASSRIRDRRSSMCPRSPAP